MTRTFCAPRSPQALTKRARRAREARRTRASIERRARIRQYSPTQVGMFLACRRKWFFGYPLGFKEPETESKRVGKKVHKEIELWHKKWLAPKDPRAWAALLSLGIDPKKRPPKNVMTEADIEIDLPPSKVDDKPRVYIGVLDHIDFRSKPTIITDHKTTSDLKYAKTDYELAGDVQMMSYAKWYFDNDADADEITVRHNVVQSRGAPNTLLPETTVDRAHVEKRWKKYLKIMDQMDIAGGLDVREVPADGITNGECEKYAGCPHRTRCFAAVFGSASASDDEEGKEDKMAAKKASGVLAALKSKMKSKSKTKSKAVEEDEEDEDEDEEEEVEAKDDSDDEDEDEDDEETSAKIAALKKKMGTKKPGTRAMLEVPKKKTAAAVVDDEDDDDDDDDEEEEAAPKKKSKRSPKKSDTKCELLCINCAPTNSEDAVHFETLMAPNLEIIENETGMSWQMHDFRKGCGLISDAISVTKFPRVIIVDSTAPLGKVSLEALIPRAENVIRGHTT